MDARHLRIDPFQSHTTRLLARLLWLQLYLFRHVDNISLRLLSGVAAQRFALAARLYRVRCTRCWAQRKTCCPKGGRTQLRKTCRLLDNLYLPISKPRYSCRSEICAERNLLFVKS